jgi:DNA-binding transcriptional MerR regulator
VNDESDRQLITIGRLGRLAGLSIGALRHYDDLGLLRPADVDAVTRYRRYGREQLDRVRTIGRLRKPHVPLDEIAWLIDAPDELARRERLDRHRQRLEARSREHSTRFITSASYRDRRS